MQVEQVNVSRLQLAQRIFKRELHRLASISTKVGLDETLLRRKPWRREPRGQYHLVPVLMAGHPLASPFLRLTMLVGVRQVEKIATLGVLVVHDSESCFFIHLAIPLLLFVAKGHAAKA